MLQQQGNAPAPTPNTPNFQIPSYVLDDLCSRFIINIPEECRGDLIRVFFQIELAHWFYLDFYCTEKEELKTCGIKDFSAQVFHHCPSLSGHAQELDRILSNWKSYKMSVPTYGAIMLDPEMKYCLLVQGFWAKASWGFPKGKVNEDEPACDCAIREVYEETGFDVTPLINKDVYLENKMNDQLSRLYIICNVSKDTKFQPKTRKEIKSLQWFPLDSLPAHKKDAISRTQLGLNPNAFFMVIPFVKPLRKWIAGRPNKPNPTKLAPRAHSTPLEVEPAVGGAAAAAAAASKQQREKHKLKQQQYFTQLNQKEYQDLLSFKDSKTRARERKQQRSETEKPGHYGSGAQSLTTPAYKSDKQQQFHILNRDGTVLSPRRNLAMQFENQSGNKVKIKQDRPERNKMGEKRQLDGFVPAAWKNFKFDVDAIMDCL